MKNFYSFLATTLLVSSFPGGSGQQQVCKVWERQLRNGTCVNCGYGEVSLSTRLFCLPCYPGFVRGERDGSFLSDCVSAAGICEPYEWAIFGKCSSCPYGMVSTTDKKRCVFCPDGLIRGNRDGSALADCVDASKLCLPNERAWRGTCSRCGKGEVSLDTDKKICTACMNQPKVLRDRCLFDVNPQTFRKTSDADLIIPTTLSGFKPTTAISVSVRMKLTQSPKPFTYIVAQEYVASGSCNYGSYGLYFNGDQDLLFYVGSDTLHGSPVFATYELDKWYHIVGTFDGSNVKLYVDGIEIGSNPGPLSKTINYDADQKPVSIGYYGTEKMVVDDTKCTPRLKGATLSELCFFSTALDATEINELITQCGTALQV